MSPAPWNSDPEVDLLQDGGHNQSIMKNIPMRPSPIIHPGTLKISIYCKYYLYKNL